MLDAHNARVTSICAVGGRIWTSSADGMIKIWKIISRKVIKVLRNENNSFKCLCKVLLPNGDVQVWASSPRLKMIQCWDPQSFNPVREIFTSHAVHAMIQQEDLVWLGMEDGEITIIRCVDGISMGSWSTTNRKTVGCFTKYQNCIWSGDDSGKIQIWYQEEEKFWFLHSVFPHFSNINFIQNVYQYMWTVSNDHSIIIWNVEVCLNLFE